MKLKHLVIIVFPMLWSCGEGSIEESVETNEEVKVVIAQVDSSQSELEVELFNMTPEPEIFESNAESELNWPNIKYFKGKLGGDDISMILNRDYNSDYEGRYFYENKGASFGISAELYALDDSIKIIRMKDNKVRETFVGSINEHFSSIVGVWIKEQDTVNFELTEQINTPQQVQVFINIYPFADFYNTQEGIALLPSAQGAENFNSFIYTTNSGEGGDYGEYWQDETAQVFFEDSIIILIYADLENSVSTIFNEGYEPNDGPAVDDPKAIKGIEHSVYGNIITEVIVNGVSTKDTIEVSEEFNVETWFFKNYIVLSDIDSENTVIYKWNRGKAIFERKN